MVTHGSQTPHGVAVGPLTQHSALARTRAAVVLPTPRAPQNRKAWWTRPLANALASVRVTCSWPTISAKVCGRYLRARTRYDISCSKTPKRKVAPGTRVVCYRCSLPGLAGFTDLASPGTINVKHWRREGDSNPRYLAVYTISNRAP